MENYNCVLFVILISYNWQCWHIENSFLYQIKQLVLTVRCTSQLHITWVRLSRGTHIYSEFRSLPNSFHTHMHRPHTLERFYDSIQSFTWNPHLYVSSSTQISAISVFLLWRDIKCNCFSFLWTYMSVYLHSSRNYTLSSARIYALLHQESSHIHFGQITYSIKITWR